MSSQVVVVESYTGAKKIKTKIRQKAKLHEAEYKIKKKLIVQSIKMQTP